MALVFDEERKLRLYHLQAVKDMYTGKPENAKTVTVDQSEAIETVMTDVSALLNDVANDISSGKNVVITTLEDAIQALIDTPPGDYGTALAALKAQVAGHVNSNITFNAATVEAAIEATINTNISPTEASVNVTDIMTSVMTDYRTLIKTEKAYDDPSCAQGADGSIGLRPLSVETGNPADTELVFCKTCTGWGYLDEANDAIQQVIYKDNSEGETGV